MHCFTLLGSLYFCALYRMQVFSEDFQGLVARTGKSPRAASPLLWFTHAQGSQWVCRRCLGASRSPITALWQPQEKLQFLWWERCHYIGSLQWLFLNWWQVKLIVLICLSLAEEAHQTNGLRLFPYSYLSSKWETNDPSVCLHPEVTALWGGLLRGRRWEPSSR